MALRSRIHSRPATSGPGRPPGSDSRSRHRPRPARARVRHRHASARELRHRAELIFGEAGIAEERGVVRERGVGPPGAGEPDGGGDLAADGLRDPVAVEEASERVVGRPIAESGVGGSVGRPWGRGVAALRERLPVWLQARVGLERRSVVALTVVLVLAAGFAVHHYWTGRPQTLRAPEVVEAAVPFGATAATPREVTASAAPGGADSTAGAVVVVDVGGKVREPGVHRLPVGSRVADALRAAGGVRPGTKLDGLNRARVLVDGEHVVVGGPAAPGPQVAADGVPGPGASAAPVSLNSATPEQLDALPGVGPVLARHIVDYRTQHGGFRSVDELREVNGIGDRRFADLRDLVRP
ncbi:helix-hairpin-helix domain-containing protein [Streptomyces sp. NPDC059477]|uniref:helix-hairpin-helix domain-containing protein n=1 Tax=Streptomyces sp. NPDC059477 TaxID=3346847 RepID=UPI0036828D17